MARAYTALEAQEYRSEEGRKKEIVRCRTGGVQGRDTVCACDALLSALPSVPAWVMFSIPAHARGPPPPGRVEPEGHARYQLFDPILGCPRGQGLMRLGSGGDGGKILCPMEELRSEQCLVLSIGSNGQTDFEEAVLKVGTVARPGAACTAARESLQPHAVEGGSAMPASRRPRHALSAHARCTPQLPPALPAASYPLRPLALHAHVDLTSCPTWPYRTHPAKCTPSIARGTAAASTRTGTHTTRSGERACSCCGTRGGGRRQPVACSMHLLPPPTALHILLHTCPACQPGRPNRAAGERAPRAHAVQDAARHRQDAGLPQH